MNNNDSYENISPDRLQSVDHVRGLGGHLANDDYDDVDGDDYNDGDDHDCEEDNCDNGHLW